MAEFEVKDVVVGAMDSTGATIVAVYAKVTARFAVYGTSERVMIQFADADAHGVNQREAIKPLAPLRAEIDSLINYLRITPSQQNTMLLSISLDMFGRGLAEALKGNMDGALQMLTTLSSELVEARAAKVRTAHVGYAAIAMIGTLLMALLLSSDLFTKPGGFSKEVSPLYWEAGAIGAFGALFSIALQFRARSIPIALQWRDNFGDAVLRIFVGAASGTILVALLKGKLVDLSIGGVPLTQTLSTNLPHGLVIVAFAAGFTERLVIPFLEKVSLPAPFGAQVQNNAINERHVTGEAGEENGSPAPTTAGKPAPQPPEPQTQDTQQPPRHADEASEQEPGEQEPGEAEPDGGATPAAPASQELPQHADEAGEQEHDSADDGAVPTPSEDTPEPDDDKKDFES